ncbi:YqaA family protein [Granulicella tundricola]|uniref:SNARE associated Golgi protein-related protein n=1 Tax=Granulicella tundricola (strain ATCC BAA-1859 / DSM 23138 / MP5ACTX9) TaxID=1198114 RepID=E8X4W8_GRATM|nr:VTT domain-containing protein [Granulicella tundricola]ADW70607.1 SNARE associated Golgi protein-related protein [Granulicella tundricola MP5ACTX9]
MNGLGLVLAGIPWRKIGGWLVKSKVWLLAVLQPFGVFGILILAIVDSSSMPLPFLDPLVVSYGAADHKKALLYCLMASLGSAIGSMVPYYLGRAGGELFLLKRINRERYEKLRDRFEKQEFLAIMLPAMCPPPMPVKLFELAAGVFEMRPVSYFLAIASGKFVRFLIESILVIVYGPAILSTSLRMLHRHLGVVLAVMGIIAVGIVIYVLRKVFDRRRGIALPVEDEAIEVGPGDAV